MRLFFKGLILIAIIVTGLLSLSYGRHSAAALSGLTLSPPLKEVTLGPGLLETSTDITLQNNTDQAVRASLKLVDLRALAEYGGTTIDKAGLTSQYDLANWLSLPGGDTLTIASKQTIKVRVNIANRPDLTPGGHYGGIVITTSPSDSAVKSEVSVNQQLISLLFIKKLGGEVYGLQLESSTFKRSSSNIPQVGTIKFKNTGNVHLVPRGYIEVTDPGGKLIAKGTINQDSLNILPGSSRKYVTVLQPVAQANGRGTYKVTTYYRYDDQKDFSQFSDTFSLSGTNLWPFIISGGAVLVIAPVMIFIIKRKIYRRIR